MDESSSLVSVYELITKLCEKVLKSHQTIVSNETTRKLRSKAYEILLSKKLPGKGKVWLEDTKDPFCHLLAWKFVLIHEHGLSDHAQKLQECVESLQKCSGLTDTALKNVLYLLLQFRQIPKPENNICVNRSSSIYSCQNGSSISFFRQFDESDFKLKVPIICAGSKFSDDSFYLKTKRNLKRTASSYGSSGDSAKDKCKSCAMHPNRITCKSSGTINKDDEKCEPSTNELTEIDIWDVVSKTKLTSHRTWETLGDPCPEHELPFVTEAEPEVSTWIYKLQLLQAKLLLDDTSSVNVRTVPQKVFIRDMKFLLVGMPSNLFRFDDKSQLILVPGTCIEGITCSAVESYCKNFIFCGNCYKALSDMCTPNQSLLDNKNHGFIFREFCESIKRYLSCYRVAISTISENSSLLAIHDQIRQLHAHLDVLASVCKVGPFTESEQLPNGVALLNYLYENLITLCDKNVIMVLYSILYPCIQVYFSRFLQQWLFEGVVNDPFNEFFIHPNQKYLNTRGRTYWTRSYTIHQDIVPDFLQELSVEILICGKAMNLLKFCMASSPLCVYLMGKKPSLLSCCLTSEKLKMLEQNASCYYLEVIAECGQAFSFGNILRCSYERDITFMNLVTKKRAATLKRLELEKLRKVQEESERKQMQMMTLRRQYDIALQEKKARIVEEIKREMKINEIELKMQSLREKLIEKEANELITYYNNLNEKLEQKRIRVEKHIRQLKNLPDAFSEPQRNSSTAFDDSFKANETNSSSETYVTVSSDTSKRNEEISMDAVETYEDMHSSQSLDVINANSDIFEEDKADTAEVRVSAVASLAAENFEIARRNKAKVMSVEMGVKISTNQQEKAQAKFEAPKYTQELSALQRNRLKMMHSEFGIYVKVDVPLEKSLSIMEINKRKNMAHTNFGTDDLQKLTADVISETKVKDEFAKLLISKCDNENFLNSNVTSAVGNVTRAMNKNELDNKTNEVNGNVETVEDCETVETDNPKGNNLKLDFSKVGTPSIFAKFFKSPNFELDKPTPMSVDSTPCTEISSSSSRIQLLQEQYESIASQVTTATTNFTDEGFNFTNVDEKKPIICFPKLQNRNLMEKILISKRVSVEEAATITTSCLKLCIQESVTIPLKTQKALVNSELLKYFVNDLQYLMHLKSLRNYFFLLDGEFGRNITEGLFEKLYDANFPVDLINCRTLQHLVYHAIDSSIKLQESWSCLSFKINNLPETFDLRSPDVLDCLSLTYKVTWPLNILLPSDTIGKYDEVFKFLLKLHRVSWVLKKMFQELKILTRETGKRSPFLMLSPHFLKLHQCRHVMMHFIQTLQNYVVGEVLQTSWNIFEKDLVSVKNLDELYSLHTTYIKNVLFMCLLNQKSAPIRKVIHKIFVIILKFYDYLRLKQWQFEEDEGVYIHPNFRKLEDIFKNFEEFVVYLYKAGRKVANVGYQPHLVQLLDMLNVNDYYTRKTVSC